MFLLISNYLFTNLNWGPLRSRHHNRMRCKGHLLRDCMCRIKVKKQQHVKEASDSKAGIASVSGNREGKMIGRKSLRLKHRSKNDSERLMVVPEASFQWVKLWILQEWVSRDPCNGPSRSMASGKCTDVSSGWQGSALMNL